MKNTSSVQKLYRVEGMHCASCAVLINKVLEKQKGMISANVSFGAEKLTITFDSNLITEEKISTLIKTLGYTLITEEGVYRWLVLQTSTRPVTTMIWKRKMLPA